MKSPWEKAYTPVRFPPSGISFRPERFVFTTGSCFAGELHQHLQNRFINCRFSPQGISYNPLSLSQGLDLLTGTVSFDPDELFEQEGQWKHPQFHGSRNRRNRQVYISDLQKDLEDCRSRLTESPLLVLTLGTAWVYRRKSTDKTVNNCHREPAELFRRDLLTIEEMKKAIRDSLNLWQETFPGSEAVISVSPVRHLRNDPRENSLSKARLLCVSQELAGEIPWLNYFPSWEIVMDELRDYRWYDQSLNHPAPEAIEYIMERFTEWAGTEELRQWLRIGGKLRKRLNHRSTVPSEEDTDFRIQTDKTIQSLKKDWPHFRRITEEWEW